MADLPYIAARLRLGLLKPHEIAQIVIQFSLDGLWLDDFVTVLESPAPFMSEVRPALEAVFKHLDQNLPDELTAVKTVAERHTRLIVGGDDPIEGMRRLLVTLEPYVHRFSDDAAVHGLFGFVALWCEFDDIMNEYITPKTKRDNALSKLRDNTIALAKDCRELLLS